MTKSSDHKYEPFYRKYPEAGDSASILPMSLATSDGDHVKRMAALDLSDVEPESSNPSFSLVKLSLERTPIHVQELNWMFRHFLPNDFDFSKIVPAHQLLVILIKCQAGLGARYIQSTDDVNFHEAIKRLKPLWYKDLVYYLEKNHQISASLIEAFLAVFIRSVQKIKVDSNGDISCDGVPKLYIFVGYTLDKAAETVALLFGLGNTIKGQCSFGKMSRGYQSSASN